jgi:translation initiation factor 3 subunit K
LTVFPSPDFSLSLHLLPPSSLSPANSAPAAGDAPFPLAVSHLTKLSNLLASASYSQFWTTLDSDDLYADLVADVAGFEELIRVRIAVQVTQSIREISRAILEGWFNLKGKEFEKFAEEVCGYKVDGKVVKVPLNKENEARGTVVRENVKFDRKHFYMDVSSVW